MLETTVLIIGAGVTGTGLARDLALRGIPSIVVEKSDINAGASGGNHGLLHSGARYVRDDSAAARECREEGELLKRLAPHCIEDVGGIFAAVAGDDEQYIADFPGLCRDCGIACEALDLPTARAMEPALSPDLIAAFAVRDAAVDPFRLSQDTMAHAVALGAIYMPRTRVVSMRREQDQGQKQGRIISVRVQNTLSGEQTDIAVQQVVNAAGAWADEIVNMVGLGIELIFSKGTLLVSDSRLTRGVVNRLRPAMDADIVVPGGTVSIVGTTSLRVGHPEDFRPTTAEVDAIIDDSKAMMPCLAQTRYIRAYARIRPLFGAAAAPGSTEIGTEDDRTVSRGFALLDHAAQGVPNMVTITGGKLTTFRLMAEKTADLICARLGRAAPCLTRTEPLPAMADGRWTEPGLAPRHWMRRNDPTDAMLCECELVPQSVVNEILTHGSDFQPNTALGALGGKSRIGKGACQGGMCSLRVAAHLYDQEVLGNAQAGDEISAFLEERWRGLHPVAWGPQRIQAELQEAMHCALFGLELDTAKAMGGES